MSEFIKSVGRRVRSSLGRMQGMTEEEYISNAVDRIDLELSIREYYRDRSSRRSILGGSSRF